MEKTIHSYYLAQWVDQRIDNYLNHSILKSYEGLIEDKKIPFYILFIDINSDQVDVNIHPTKTEVKFEDEKLIYSLINSSVNRSLEKYNISPSLNFDADINFVKKAVVNYDQNMNASKTISHLEKKTNWDEIFNKVKVEVKPSQIVLKTDLNKIGEYKVDINFHSEVSAQISIKIEKIQSI